MVSTFTPNIQLEEPARGDLVGVWDTPVNNNETLTDLVVGGITTISLNNSPVVLAAAQFQSKGITFGATLTGSVTITFPTSFKKSYEVQNLCTGSSAFVITLATTATGGQVICCPPGETIDCFNDGTNIKFKNLGRIGSYWDDAGSSVPAWVDGCSPQKPYLPCDGTVFSSATYPFLTVKLGGTTLPDFRGRLRGYLNAGTGRITSSQGGVDGNTAYASGGLQTTLISSIHLPASALNEPSSGHTHTTNAPAASGGTLGPVGGTITGGGIINPALTGITFGSSSPVPLPNLPPITIGGITMIRAA